MVLQDGCDFFCCVFLFVFVLSHPVPLYGHKSEGLVETSAADSS